MAYGIQSPGKGLIVKTIFSTLFFKININYGTKREEKKKWMELSPFSHQTKGHAFSCLPDRAVDPTYTCTVCFLKMFEWESGRG